ncbi:hypothetical protein COCHEDRAFT_1049321, partial [Bipolaris maydis C5]
GRGEEGRVRLGELAGAVGFTPRYFHRIFKERMGVTPREWVSKVAGDKRREEGGGSTGVVEMGEQAWVGEKFDFSDLIDFGADAETRDFDHLAGPWNQSFIMDPELSLDANGLSQPWSAYAPAQAISGFFQPMPDDTSFCEKTMSFTSTLELDASVLLNWDN